MHRARKKLRCHCEERSKPAPAKAGEAIPTRDCHAPINRGSQ